MKPLIDLGALGAIVWAILFFVDRRFWPWYTKEYFPAKQRQADAMTTALVDIGGSLESMKTLEITSQVERSTMIEMLQTLHADHVKFDTKFINVDDSLIALNTSIQQLRYDIASRKGDSRPIPVVQTIPATTAKTDTGEVKSQS